MKYTTIDLEWRQQDASILCAAFYNEKDAETFDTVEELLTGIFKAHTKNENIFYSHFGGGSDFLFLLKYLVGRKDVYINEHEFYEVNGKIISFTIVYKNKRYQFRDSYAILPASLNQLSESFLDISKKYDSSKLEELNIKNIKEQCLNDCILLYKVINNFITELGLSGLPLTAASLALSDMKQRADFKKLIVQSKSEYELFSTWFKGGHTDVYKRYSEPCYQYDINSCYSASQILFGCPIGRFSETKRRNDNKAGLYIVKINSKIENPFYWQNFADGYNKLYFLNSNEYFYLTDIDILELEKEKINFKILNGYEWERDDNFFKDFVYHWYEYRKSGGAKKIIGKLFLNAGGYGKFAIRRNREVVAFGAGCDYYFSPDFEIGIKRKWKDFDYSQIHIASRITSGARILLFRAQNQIGIENLCYSDTDSVYSTKKYDINQKNLGGMKMEGEYKRAYFLGNKFYGKVNMDNTFEGVLKGFPDKNFNEDNYKMGLKGNLTFKYASVRLLKFRSALRRTSDFVGVREFLREVKSLEIKRRLLNDGIHTQPYYLKNGELR